MTQIKKNIEPTWTHSLLQMKRMFAMFSGSKFVRETRRKGLVGDDADLNVWFKFHSKYSPRIVGVRVVAGQFYIQSTFPKNKVPHKKIEQLVMDIDDVDFI